MSSSEDSSALIVADEPGSDWRSRRGIHWVATTATIHKCHGHRPCVHARGRQRKKSRTPREEISRNQVEIMRNQSRFPWNQARKSAQPSSPTHFYNIWRHFWEKSRGNQREIRKSKRNQEISYAKIARCSLVYMYVRTWTGRRIAQASAEIICILWPKLWTEAIWQTFEGPVHAAQGG